MKLLTKDRLLSLDWVKIDDKNKVFKISEEKLFIHYKTKWAVVKKDGTEYFSNSDNYETVFGQVLLYTEGYSRLRIITEEQFAKMFPKYKAKK